MKLLVAIDDDSLWESVLATLRWCVRVRDGDHVAVLHVKSSSSWLPHSAESYPEVVELTRTSLARAEQLLCAAVDGSRESLLGIESFARKTRAGEAEVRLLHALDLPPRTVWNVFSDEDDLEPQSLPEPLRRRVEHAFCPALAALRVHGVEATTELRRGRPAQEILDAAVRHRADLIVMSARGLTGLRGLLVGSVTQRVVRYGATSVLVAR
jgi:nucleotide-binding universal stress UspA family protein